MSRILVVEDDKTLNDGIAYALRNEGYEVIQDYGRLSLKEKVDLVLLDVNLPDRSGYERIHDFDVPVIFITANNQEMDILKGFNLGCEDYVTKPFSIAVLKEKIKVVLRRFGKTATYVSGGLSYDKTSKDLIIDHKAISLTKKEYKLLDYFLENKEIVLTKDQLLEHLWDQDGDFVNEGTVNVTINRLRKKIDPDSKWIKTVFGIGYKWSEKDV